MKTIAYLAFDQIDPAEFLDLLNQQKIRTHLIEHEPFNLETVKNWISEKIKMDARPDCKIRAVTCNKALAGWCGVQIEDDKPEIAIVIDHQFWGIGPRVFKETMRWAKDLNHDEIYLHLLETRSQYKFLNKIALECYKSELLGHQFTTYKLKV